MTEAGRGAPPQAPARPTGRTAAKAAAAARARRMGAAPRPRPKAGHRVDLSDEPPEAELVTTENVLSTGTKTAAKAVTTPGTATRPGAGARPRAKTKVGERSAPTRPAAARRERHARPWRPVLLAALLVVVLAATTGWLMATRPQRLASATDRTKLLSSVKASTALILSYDYRHLPADIAAASPHLSGDYKVQYLTAMNRTVSPKAIAEKAVVTGEVSAAGLESVSADGRTATVLVLGQINYTSTKVSQGRTDVFRIRVTAQLAKGGWLISKIDPK